MLGLAILCFAINALGQNQITEPNECKTPSGGIVKGGSFIADTGLCLDYNIALGSTINPATPLTLTGGTFDAGSVRYLFNYKDSDGAPQFPANLIPQYTYTTPGTYWIMMTGKSGGKSYITCRSVEVILPEQPVIKTSSCDPKNVTIKILNDPINLKLGSVRIDWGDGTPPLF